MATVRDFYTGDGTTVLFSLSFEYLDQDDILVTVNGVPTTAFGFVNASTIQFSAAPANGAAIAIIRQTPVDDPKAVFFAGSPIRAADLNQNNTQLLYVAQETSQLSDDANVNSNLAITTANGAVVTANTAEANSLTAISTANTAESNSLAAVSTANTAESNSLAAVSTANAASVTAGNAVSTANSAVSTANAATVTANAATATANQAALDAAAAVVTANAADVKADAAVLTANAADANASAAVSTANSAVSTANSAVSTANSAVSTANTAESNSLSAISTANSAAAAVASAVLYTPVVDLAALALLTPLDGEFFELQDSTGADTDPSITGVPVGLVGSAGLTFRLRYDDPPGEYVFLGYFANDSETRYLKTGTGTVTSTNILDGTIVDADINASAAIAGTKVSPDFGNQTVQTTGVISHALGAATAPTITFTGDLNTGLYSPGADQVAISTNGTGRLFVDASGSVSINTSSPGAGFDVNNSAFVRGGQKINGYFNLDAGDGVTTNIGTSGGINYIQSVNGATPAELTIDANPLVFRGSSFTERMRLDSSGRLGLGTSSPRSNFDISKDGVVAAGNWYNLSHITDASGNKGFQLGYDNTSQTSILAASTTGTASNLQFYTYSGSAWGPRVTVTSAGLVGIGITSPDYLVHAASAVTGGGDVGFRMQDTTSNKIVQLMRTGSTFSYIGIGDTEGVVYSQNTLSLAADDSSPIKFCTGAERARIDSSGRLLVGTSTTSVATTAILQGSSAGTTADAELKLARGLNNPGDGATLSALAFSDSSHTNSAVIFASRDGGTWSASSKPTRLVFSTTADGASSPTERMRIDNAGRFKVQGVYDNTTVAAANVWVDTDGSLRRSTSSIKYKIDVETLEDKYADAILNVRPVWYRSIAPLDNAEWGWWGFIAEEVAEIDPRLVQWKTSETKAQEDGSLVTTELDKPEPEGVQYDRFVPHLLNLIKRQGKAIAELQAKVAALEAS
jgi:hypothetical protein